MPGLATNEEMNEQQQELKIHGKGTEREDVFKIFTVGGTSKDTNKRHEERQTHIFNPKTIGQ